MTTGKPSNSIKLTLLPDIQQIGCLSEFVNKIPLSETQALQTNLVLEEILANIILYGETASPIEIVLEQTEAFLRIHICDEGKAFNPLEMPEPDLSTDVADRPIGGLGLYLVGQFTSSQHYIRQDNKNILTLIIP